MKVLLFGASGHIGSGIARELLSRGHVVTGVTRKGTEDAGHLVPTLLQEGHFFLGVAVVVGKPGGKARLVVAEEQRPVLGDDALQAVDPRLVRIGQVADDFQRAPAARHGAGQQLLAAQTSDDAAHRLGPREVGVHQFGE